MPLDMIFKDFVFPVAMVIVLIATVYRLFAWATGRQKELESRVEQLITNNYAEREVALKLLDGFRLALTDISKTLEKIELRMEKLEDRIHG